MQFDLTSFLLGGIAGAVAISFSKLAALKDLR